VSTLPTTSPPRDPRLDFFRGVAMFIIYIAHCRGNFLYDYIPARYGISDAANMFVFISGMTASIAFGGTFLRQGWLIGTARIAYRCLQLYAAQIGMFFAVAVVVVLGTRWYGDTDYVALAQFQRFFNDPSDALVGLFTLTYVPHYIDILPLYIVALAMVPVAMALARLSPRLVLLASVALYLIANLYHLDLPANADDQPMWYFNPFAWQLIFFTGFALRRGWVKVPLDSKLLLWTSVAILVAGLAISLPSVFERVAAIDAFRIWIDSHSNKTFMDPLQYVHFLASAYVALVVLKAREHVLLTTPLRPFVKCGQQALSIFTSGMVLSYIGGMIFDHAGTGALTQIAVNGVTFALLFAIAYGVAWFKAAPWKRRAVMTLAAAEAIILMIGGSSGTARADEYGYEHGALSWQGATRSYLLRVPPKPADAALPLVIALHGAGESAGGFAEETHLAAAGDAMGMMVAFPAGTERAPGRETFNAQICCGDAVGEQVDDVGFVGALIDDIAAHHPLDRSRVYATGMSNGGMLVHQLAARHPEWFAAVAPVSATIGGMTRDGHTYIIPMANRPVPMLIIHGKRDGLVLYDGGSSPNLSFPYRWKMSAPDALSFWAAVDGCAGAAEISEPVPGTLSLTRYAGCNEGSEVALVTIADGEHAWPGDIFPAASGKRSAAAEILAFFARFRRAPALADEPPPDHSGTPIKAAPQVGSAPPLYR
jgi:poly(3-hydroxybutyrate) depolymerase